MRIRSIKEGYWQHEMHGRISETAAILGAAMLNYADDEGRFKVQFSAMRSLLFTHRKKTDEEIEAAYRELESERYVTTYNCMLEGRPTTLCQVTTFKRHQVISHPKPSRLPQPPPSDSSNVPVSFPERSMNVPASTIPTPPSDSSNVPVGRKEGEDGRSETRGRADTHTQFVEPSLEDVLTYGRSQTIAEERCRKFYFDAKGTGWTGKKGAIKDWKAALHGFSEGWDNNKKTPNGADPDEKTVAQLEAELEGEPDAEKRKAIRAAIRRVKQ